MWGELYRFSTVLATSVEADVGFFKCFKQSDLVRLCLLVTVTEFLMMS